MLMVLVHKAQMVRMLHMQLQTLDTLLACQPNVLANASWSHVLWLQLMGLQDMAVVTRWHLCRWHGMSLVMTTQMRMLGSPHPRLGAGWYL